MNKLITHRLLPEDMIQSLREESTDDIRDKQPEELVMICLIKSYFNNICKLTSNGSYIPINLLDSQGSNEGNIKVQLHQDCVLHFSSTV